MPYAAVNDIEVYYERQGAGQGLLFISGTGGDLRRRPNQLDAPISQAFDMITYDQRGLGQTSQPPGPYAMAQYADDAAALLDHLEIVRIHVMGVSFGGMVAQELALRHPSRVSRLVLACTSSGGVGGASYPLHELQSLAAPARVAQQLQLADIRRDEAWIAANPEAWQRLLEIAGQHQSEPTQGALSQLQARRDHNTYDRLPQLTMPVLLVGGEYDGIAPPDNMRALHQQIAHSELRLFDGGHLFLVQDKTAYPYIIQWLSG